MKASTLFTINAVVSLIFGLAFVLAPGATVALYDVQLSDAGIYVARLLGAAFLTFAVLTWMVRFATASAERRAIVLALLVGDVIGLVASVLAQLAGLANALGWSTVVIYLLFALGYGTLWFAGERDAAQPGMVG